MFREGLSLLLENTPFQVTAQATGLKYVERLLLSEPLPSLLLIEWPPDTDPASHSDELILLENLCARIPVVVMSDILSQARVERVLKAGAKGFLLKDISAEILSQYLLLVLLGETVLPSMVARVFLEEHRPFLPQQKAIDQLPANLRDREKQILLRLLHGESNKSIARKLEMSENAVKVQLKSILRKISVRNRTQAAVWAMSRGIIPSELVVPGGRTELAPAGFKSAGPGATVI